MSVRHSTGQGTVSVSQHGAGDGGCVTALGMLQHGAGDGGCATARGRGR